MNAIKYPLYLSSSAFYGIRHAATSGKLIQENKILSQEAEALKGALTQLEELKAENQRLKQILSFKEKSQLAFIACPVIAKDPSGIFNSIIIGAGKKQGIVKNTTVITPAGIVGRVTEIAQSISRVLLITDPSSKIMAIDSRSRCEGMLYGVSQGLCKLVYLAPDADIKKDDMIITSGFSSAFPKGLAIGKVVRVEFSPNGIWLQAIVKPEFDISRIEEVLCVK
ncbi:MAG: rod shape-determining protein MreC [Candidatus Omnitrophica bacterium]|nr:rod shape-determining protein MreC [Candidatus Omnitrophota bacterium]